MSDRRPAFGRSLASATLAASLLLSLAGCGDGKIKCVPVSGSVIFDGKPYPGARVMFVPMGGGEKFQKERPFGITDESGNFQLTTFAKADGAPAGEYQVMIRTASPRGPEQAKAWGRRPKIDPKFGKPDSSGIIATVESEPTELAPFDVSSAQRR